MKPFAPLLQTKLYCPTQPGEVVRRKRLLSSLDRALEVPLTLVSAPPGYGKSVLAASWANDQEQPVAWLILDAEENSLPRFLAYLVAALERAWPGAFRSTAALLATSEPPSVERIGQRLADEVSAVGEEVLVVLDDFHLVDHGSDVHDLLDALLGHPPAHLHLVVLTRRDPPIPLARLRANNQLTELRLDDLRFRRDETGELLRTALGREVDAEVVAHVQDILEGWGAGIRMASLAALRAEGDDVFLRRLPGGLQHIQEYFFDEAIAGLDRPTLRYMLVSALPDRFSAALLDEIVAGLPEPMSMPGSGGAAFIRFVQRNNMFTTSVDPGGQWFRYHNLFRELLLQRLRRVVDRASIVQAATRASAWLEARNGIDDAIRLLIDQGLTGAAAEMVERHRADVLDEDQWVTLEGWLGMFPASESGCWPTLLLVRASLATFNFDIDLVADLVRQLDGHAASGALTAAQRHETEFFRAVPLLWTGDIDGARRALETSAEASLGCQQIAGERHVYQAIATTLTGNYAYALERLDHAEEQNGGRRDTLATRLAASKSYVHYITLAMPEALHHAERLALMAASDRQSEHARGWGLYMQVLCLLNTGRFEAAHQAVREALPCGDFVEQRVLAELFLAGGLCAVHLGDDDALRQAIDALRCLAGTAATGTGVPELALSGMARIHLSRGDVDQASGIAEALPRRPSSGTLVFWLEEPALTWVRTQLALGTGDAARLAVGPLVELRRQAESQHLDCQRVDLLFLEAIARSRLGQPDDALACFAEAVDLAMPAGWIRPFAEASRWATELSPDALPHQAQRAFTRQALQSAPAVAPESFTNRELDILELLAERCRNKDIARKLFISTNTVNFHLKHVYRKLDVSGRREAVVRAAELGLLRSH